MAANPYQHSAEVMETQPPRGRGLARRLVWFAIGFAVSWGIWSAISYFYTRPQDITQSWPQEIRDVVPPEMEWIKEAKARKIGQFVVAVPAESQNASAMLSPQPPSHFPQVVFLDEGPDGRIDCILVMDAKRRNFSIDVADGMFKSFICTTRIGGESISYRDGNMDGEYDYRFVPGKAGTIMVQGEWREYVQEGDTRYVDVDGRRTALKLIDGVWQVADDL